MMMRCPAIPLAISFLLMFPGKFAEADIAPDPMTGGFTLKQYGEEITEVRMVEEDVIVRVFDSEIVTTAEFCMRNEGETVRMEVGFPYNYQGEFIEFRAFVNGREVDVRDGKQENVGRKKTTVYWKLWKMTFEEGESYGIRVEYKTEPFEMSLILSGKNEYSSLPDDEYWEIRTLTRCRDVAYWLDTGKHWKGVLDRCRITFELAGKSDENIQYFGPEDGVLTGGGIVWEYTDYEPRGFVRMRYYPNMAVKDITSYLCGIVERYPYDPKLASDIGGKMYSYFGEKELMNEIYHSFLARWDGVIPQLMEYASGGRCRFNFKTCRNFHTTWRMALFVFDEYEKRGELERARDIAPVVSRISGAIVDSLDTCGNLSKTNADLLKNAKELLDLSNSLIGNTR
jgi:hypothetical protein